MRLSSMKMQICPSNRAMQLHTNTSSQSHDCMSSGKDISNFFLQPPILNLAEMGLNSVNVHLILLTIRYIGSLWQMTLSKSKRGFALLRHGPRRNKHCTCVQVHLKEISLCRIPFCTHEEETWYLVRKHHSNRRSVFLPWLSQSVRIATVGGILQRFTTKVWRGSQDEDGPLSHGK